MSRLINKIVGFISVMCLLAGTGQTMAAENGNLSSSGLNEVASFTVDFHSEDNTYCIPGLSSISISSLSQELGLGINAAEVADVIFSNPELVRPEMTADGQWQLVSLAPFLTEELLTITMNDGSSFQLKVTDGYDPDLRYFEWPETSRGLVIWDYIYFAGILNLHYKGGHFYCDEGCTVECIGIGYDQQRTGAINWWPLVNLDNMEQVLLTNLNVIVDANKTSFYSPKDLKLLSIMLNNAIYVLKKNGGVPIEWNKVELNIIIHDTMEINEAAFYKEYNSDQQAYIINLEDTRKTPGVPYVLFAGKTTIKRYDGFSGPMLEIKCNDGKHVNFRPSDNTTFDNNTTNNSDVVVKVDERCLFIYENSTITNSKSGGTKAQYYGTGVQILSGGNVELGKDAGGSCITKKCHIGMDVLNGGVLRLKSADPIKPYTVADNQIAINLAYGGSIGKWADNISMVNSKDVLITLAEPTLWKTGDVVFTSGMSLYGSKHNTPLQESDMSIIEFANANEMTQLFSLEYDTKHDSSREDYEVPLFRLSLGKVYNSRNGKWFNSLNNAVTNQDFPIQDGDELVYYGNVNEQRAVEIKNNLTIRSAKAGSSDASVPDAPEISSSGYTSKWFNTTSGATSFITVASGKTLTIGGSTSGPYTIDANGYGRAIYVNGGTLNTNANATIKNGTSSNGGSGVYVSSGGTLNQQGAAFSNNQTTANNGGAIYNLGTLSVAAGSFQNNGSNKDGSAIYQGGTMNISGAPVFGNADDVYLATDHYITKTGAITMTGKIPVTLQNETAGRDILISKQGASGSSNGQVVEADLGKIDADLSTDYTFELTYNATGNDSGITPKDVIELKKQLKDLIITKSGMKEGETAVFTVTSAEDPALTYKVAITIGSSNTGTATIKSLPVAKYIVTEETSWSWSYTPKNAVIQQNIGVNNKFSFTNSAHSQSDPGHAESSAKNVFGTGNIE